MTTVRFYTTGNKLAKYCRELDIYNLGNDEDFANMLAKAQDGYLSIDELESVAKDIIEHTSEIAEDYYVGTKGLMRDLVIEDVFNIWFD